MQPSRLENCGIKLPLLGLGCVKFGRNQDVKYPEAFELPTDAELRRLLNTALELKIDLLDTAPAYGNSEERIGRLINKERQRWLLCTKVGEIYEPGRSQYDFTPEHTHASVMASLVRLQTEVLDMVLIHSNGDDMAILDQHGTLGVLQELKAQGHIRSVGVSHITVAGGLRAIELGADVLMTTLNPNDTEQLPVIAAAHEAGCGVLVKKALASGWAQPEALQFSLQTPGVNCAVVGTVNEAHLRQNAKMAGMN